MKNDIHLTSRLLTCAGALMIVSGILMAVCVKLSYGGILWAAAACMFFAAWHFQLAENKTKETVEIKIKNKSRSHTLKKALIFAACLLPIGAIGGYFTGKYAIASYSPEMRQTILDQVGSVQMLAIVAMAQSALYAFVAGVIGYLASVKISLMKPLRIRKQELLPSLGITLGCGVIMALDYWTFGAVIPEVRALYEDGILYKNVDNWLASVFYGGIIEEVLLRLCVMSVLGLIIWKGFFRSSEEAPTSVIIAANLLSALLFAAGHLPTTVSMFGALSPLVVVRCFLLNGILGAAFGRLYRKYGIQYAMLAHAGTHIISKIIWLLLL